jgi:osmoprotectant transport system ATP-binding protein
LGSEHAVEFAGVSASRGGRAVLRNVSAAIDRGTVLALVGRSGSGKTTLLRLINRLIEPDAGSIMVEGRSTREWNPIALRLRTGYVIQEAGLFPNMTVASNIAIVPRLLKWPQEQVSIRVDELLSMSGLEPGTYRGRWPDELSGGERQRVGLARALAADPPLLLMDEPFGALDPITRSELHDHFKRMQERLRRTVILVTHDMVEACSLADRIAVLHDGELIAHDTVAAIGESADPRVRGLVAR